MKNHQVFILAAVLVIAVAGFANAGSYGPTDVSINWPAGDNTDIEDLLNSAYFGTYNVIDPGVGYNFYGAWEYTAIAYEAGNENVVRVGTPQNDQMDYSFSNVETSGNAEYLAFGTWDTVVFGDDNSGNPPSDNLRFKDASDDDPKPLLDPFPHNSSWGDTSQYLKLFQLTENSNPLTWLSDPDFYLEKGTIIVGFNDNYDGGDNDFDDIIVAMKPVPEPGTIFLLGVGLVSLAGIRRKMSK